MTKSVLPLLISCLWLLSGAAKAQERAAPAGDFPLRIRAALEAGRIDQAQADRYWEQAVRAPAELPPELRRSVQDAARAARTAFRGQAVHVVRCGTPYLRGSRGAPTQSPPRTAERAAERLIQVGDKVGIVDLASYVVTEHFTIEWGPFLTNEDGTLPVLDVGPTWAGDPVEEGTNGIPDVVERWAAYLEATFREEVTQRGFNHPAFDQVFIPIVLGNSDPDSTIDDIGPTTYGFTQRFAAEGLPDGLSFIVMNNDFTFLQLLGIANDEPAINPDDPLALLHGGMKITAAHEFFHTIQFLYDTFIPVEDAWWDESSATWMEDEAFDEINDYYQYFSGGIDREDQGGAPAGQGWADLIEDGLAIDVRTAQASQIYGGVVFPKYLQQHVAGADSILEIWTRIRGGMELLPALDAFSLGAGYAGGLGELYQGFGGSNGALATEYEEGGNFGAVPLRKDILAADSTTDTIPGSDPAEPIPVPLFLGSTYLTQDTVLAPLQLTLDGTPPVDWGLSLLVQRTAPDRTLVLGSTTPIGIAVLPVPALIEGERVTAAVNFLDGATDPAAYLTLLAPTAIEANPPGPVANLDAVAVVGGLDVVWGAAADDAAVAGYAVRVVDAIGDTVVSRSLFGASIRRVEIRELATGVYDVAVYAYDTSGNEGPDSTFTGLQVTAAEPTPTPIVPILDQEINAPQELPGARGIGGAEGIGEDYGFDKVCFIGILGQ